MCFRVQGIGPLRPIELLRRPLGPRVHHLGLWVIISLETVASALGLLSELSRAYGSVREVIF